MTCAWRSDVERTLWGLLSPDQVLPLNVKFMLRATVGGLTPPSGIRTGLGTVSCCGDAGCCSPPAKRCAPLAPPPDRQTNASRGTLARESRGRRRTLLFEKPAAASSATHALVQTSTSVNIRIAHPFFSASCMKSMTQRSFGCVGAVRVAWTVAAASAASLPRRPPPVKRGLGDAQRPTDLIGDRAAFGLSQRLQNLLGGESTLLHRTSCPARPGL